MNEWEWQLLEEKNAVDHLEIAGVRVHAGSRVRLCPRPGGDIMDIALVGQVATIECIEQDYEGKHHVCVVLDNDPGKDMGLLRQPGHRFFFDAEEVEPLPEEDARQLPALQKPTILVAGIGNIFLGDDAFGVEVARRLATVELPQAVRVHDFGIRGFDLAYALQDGYDTTILVDACPHGEAPGTLYVIEPDLTENRLGGADTPVREDGSSASYTPTGVSAPPSTQINPPTIDAHTMNPMNVLRMARAMNIEVRNLLVVGCEPETLGGEEGHMGLSVPVEAAVDEAVKLVTSIVKRILDKSSTTSGLHSTP